MSALEQAIEIWRERANIGDLADYKHTSCPLCDEHPMCLGCNVFQKTGQENCNATPFYAAFIERVVRKDLPAFKAKAAEMVALLESCR